MDRLITKYDEENVPKEICTIDRFGEADDCSSCAEICEECNSDCENCAIQKCFNKLADYEDAEEQGLLHKAEIPNGTTIYTLQTDEDDRWFVHSESYLYGLTEYFYGKLGKDFWIAEEEAEKALADMGV